MVYSLRGSVRRISIHSITITSQSCNSCPSSLSSQHTSTHKATHRTEKMQHQYPSDTPDTPATGKGLWRVAKSVPLPLPPPYPSPNPGGFENPCPSLATISLSRQTLYSLAHPLPSTLLRRSHVTLWRRSLHLTSHTFSESHVCVGNATLIHTVLTTHSSKGELATRRERNA